MILRELSIEAFGVWKGLRLTSLTPDLNVFYGPNEAGKTTVLQFVRSMFYGFSPERRRRYLPPAGGGNGGGRLELEVQGKRFQLERYENEAYPLGRLTLRDESGAAPSPQALEQWLGGLEDKLYTHVFALELDELQELGTLSDMEAARRFYELSVGLGDVRLESVLDSLRDDRRRRLGTPEQRARIQDLIAQRKALHAQLDQHRPDLDAEQSLSSAQRELEARIGADEARIAELEDRLKRLEGLAAVDGLLRQRDRLQARLDDLRQTRRLSPQAVDRLEKLEQRLVARRARKETQEREARKVRSEAEKITVQSNWKGRRREVEALAGQLPWLEALELRSAEWRKEVARCEAELATLRKQTGAAPQAAAAQAQSGKNASANPQASRTAASPGSGAAQLLGSAPLFALPTSSPAPAPSTASAKGASIDPAALAESASEAAWEKVRPLAAKAIQARRAFRKHQVRARKRREQCEAAAQRIASGLPEATHRDLELAWEEVARHVELMHERLQLEHRVSQLHQDYQEAAARGAELIDSQVMPAWALYGLAGLFTFGLMLLSASFLIPSWFSSQWGWLLSLAGLGGLGIAGAVNYAWQRAAEFRLEKAQQQAEGLSAAIVQLQEEQRRIDVELPTSNIDLHERLAQAEDEKARLEEMLPLATQRKSLKSKVQSAVKKARAAHAQMNEAMSAFQSAVKAHGLPEKILPTQIQSLGKSFQQAAQLQARANLFKQEIDRHQVLVDRLRGQVQKLFQELGQPAPQDLKAGLEKLTKQLRDRSDRLAQKRSLKDQYRKVRRRGSWDARVLAGLEKTKQKRLAAWGVGSAAEAAKLIERLAEARKLREEHKSLTASLKETARGVGGAAAAVAELAALEGGLAAARSGIERELKVARDGLQSAYQELGRLEARSESPTDDKLRDELRRQLDVVETELQTACEAWQGLALAEALLDAVRVDFEEHRQPRTLVQASEYLRALTEGGYVKIRSTIADRTLYVEDADGRILAVEKLSRGARELLYLALRLAIVDDYADKGVRLPVVLDDLFVNFDERRTQAAVRLLVDFARRGRQVVVLTCHGHTANYFQDQGVPVRGLPPRDPETGRPAAERTWSDFAEPAATPAPTLVAERLEPVRPIRAAASASAPLASPAAGTANPSDRTPGWSETRLDRIVGAAAEPAAGDDATRPSGNLYGVFDGDGLDDETPSVIEVQEVVEFPAPTPSQLGMEPSAPVDGLERTPPRFPAAPAPQAEAVRSAPPDALEADQEFHEEEEDVLDAEDEAELAETGHALLTGDASNDPVPPPPAAVPLAFSAIAAAPDSIWWSHEMQIGEEDAVPTIGSELVQVEEIGEVVDGSSFEHPAPLLPQPPAIETREPDERRSALGPRRAKRKKLRRPIRPAAGLEASEKPSAKPPTASRPPLLPTRDLYSLAEDLDSGGSVYEAAPPRPNLRDGRKPESPAGDPRSNWWRLGAWPVDSSEASADVPEEDEDDEDLDDDAPVIFEADSPSGWTAPTPPTPAPAPIETWLQVDRDPPSPPQPPTPPPSSRPPRAYREVNGPGVAPSVRPVRSLQPRLYSPELEEIVVEPDEAPTVRFIDVPLDAFLGAASPSAAAAAALAAEPRPEPDDDLELDVEFDAPPTSALEPEEKPAPRRAASERRAAAGKKRKKKRPSVQRRIDPPATETPQPSPPPWRSTQVDATFPRWPAPPAIPPARSPSSRSPNSGSSMEDFVSWAEWGGPPGEDG